MMLAGQLSGALESENINSVMANFNIDPSPGMPNLVRLQVNELINKILLLQANIR